MNRDEREYLEVLGFDPSLSFLSSTPPGNFIPSVAQAAPEAWTSLEEKALACQSCPLSKSRKNVVFGVGDRNATLVFVGEGPGEEEDRQALPFVGPAGELLNRMILAMGLQRKDVYIANVVKCRPPENRNPKPDELAACSSFLERQLELLGPKLVVALGTFAAQALLQSQKAIGDLRGQFYLSDKYKSRSNEAVQILPTYHPAFLLRSPHMKKVAWEDLKKAMLFLGLRGPT